MALLLLLEHLDNLDQVFGVELVWRIFIMSSGLARFGLSLPSILLVWI
jgi:hypothetical protein